MGQPDRSGHAARRGLALQALFALAVMVLCLGCGPDQFRVSYVPLQIAAAAPKPPPPPPPPQETKQIKIDDRIEFVVNSAKLQKSSFKVLDQVVKVMKENAGLKLVEVQGHTDASGKEEKNQELSQSRAESVMAYLVKKGIAADRLRAKGFGQSKPLGDNDSAEGKSKNRRVEFHIIEGAESAGK